MRFIILSIFALLVAPVSYAASKGDIIKLNQEAQFALKTNGNIKLVKKMGIVSGFTAWAAIPVTKDGKEHPMRIIYLNNNGTMFLGAMFDKDMNFLNLQYAKKLQDDVMNKVLSLDSTLSVYVGQGNAKWEQPIYIYSPDDSWIEFVRQLNLLVISNDFFKGVKFHIYYRPVGSDLSLSAVAWSKYGDSFSDFVIKGDSNNLQTMAKQANPYNIKKLYPIVDEGNKQLDMFGIKGHQTNIVYRNKVLPFNQSVTMDQISQFITGYKLNQL